MKLDVHYDFLPKKYSVNASVVMDHFGIDFEQGRHVIAQGLELPIEAGDVVLFTGSSGSGKSSLMRAAAESLEEGSAVRGQGSGVSMGRVSNPPLLDPRSLTPDLCGMVWIDRLELPERILADALPMPVEKALGLYGMCGLSEAQLLLRTPAELSDGQRYRFRLAMALAQKPQWIVADEFTATLDRTLAKVIAFNLRRLALQSGTGFLLATTHEDIVEELNPDLWVRCELDGNLVVERRSAKKNESASPTTYGSAKAPRWIGRTLLGGITAATTSARRDE